VAGARRRLVDAHSGPCRGGELDGPGFDQEERHVSLSIEALSERGAGTQRVEEGGGRSGEQEREGKRERGGQRGRERGKKSVP